MTVSPRAIAEQDRMYFGQDSRQAGHYWLGPTERRLRGGVGGRVGDCPFGHEVDGKIQPLGRGGYDAPFGECSLTIRDGWTCIAWNENSGPDKRPGCHSAFVMRGEHGFNAMVAAFAETYPWAFGRMHYALHMATQGRA